jgi:hypothetical protein
VTPAHPLPVHLYAVIRFTGQSIAGIFPSLRAAREYRDTHCTSAGVFGLRILDDGKHYVVGAEL